MENKPTVLYRCEFKVLNRDYAETYDEQEIGIEFVEYPIVKTTAKGYFIKIPVKWNSIIRKYVDKPRFVLSDPSGKRFAYVEKSRALEAFIIRRNSYALRLESQLRNNKRLIKIAKKLQNETATS